MLINLAEISDSGKSFVFDRQTGELNQILEDILGKNPYQIDFFIRPIGTGYELTGNVKTKINELCYRCADDIQLDVSLKLHELLLPHEAEPRKYQYAKTNHVSELNSTEPNAVFYEGTQFDAGEYLHEMIALEKPLQPAPPQDEDGKCTQCGIECRNQFFSYDETAKQKPFETLKTFKLKN